MNVARFAGVRGRRIGGRSFSPFLRQLRDSRLVLFHALGSDALSAVLHVEEIHAADFHFAPDGFTGKPCVGSQLEQFPADGGGIRDFAGADAARAVDGGLFHTMCF